MTLLTILRETDTKVLVRSLASSKAYLYFDISVFNAGTVINIKCTDRYKEDSARSWNGQNFCLENDSTTKYYISKELQQRELSKYQKTVFNRNKSIY